MKIEQFDFDLPKELIAQVPAARRDDSRLLIVERSSGTITCASFKDIVSILKPGDAIVLNDTRVRPARLIGKAGQSHVDILLVERMGKNLYLIKAKPGKKIKQGTRIDFGDNFSHAYCKVDDTSGQRKKILEFDSADDIENNLNKIGLMPLPPYIKRLPVETDASRYQTVYAKNPGAIASPTAGLHFTAEILKKIKDKGVDVIYLTLHVGLGTFTPVRVDDVRDHPMHEELFNLPAQSALKIEKVKKKGGRIFAVGTTTCRVLESCAKYEENNLYLRSGAGKTGIFIYPGYKFKATDVLLTNFHLPKTTLLMLVYAFAGKRLAKEAYAQAIEHKYRFYSYGDCMLIV
ncbi:MAG: tRNA preQ1(34) S-adenosylmethionine ribosyltransferase-isomerase QueA [Candidatus Omnitrophica bacterium]|nr:tRNA preQ1(34) S-adenosylmethionine ribosyltransferase-isomerase QueA [Candidatus Omnitrophota bacterium]